MKTRGLGRVVTFRDLQRFAKNIGRKLQDQDQKNFSVAVCLDVLVDVLDRNIDNSKKISEQIKEELESRKNPPKTENADTTSKDG